MLDIHANDWVAVPIGGLSGAHPVVRKRCSAMYSSTVGDIDRSAVPGSTKGLGVIGSPEGLMSLVSLIRSWCRRPVAAT
jgi:hypothetical protein